MNVRLDLSKQLRNKRQPEYLWQERRSLPWLHPHSTPGSLAWKASCFTSSFKLPVNDRIASAAPHVVAAMPTTGISYVFHQASLTMSVWRLTPPASITAIAAPTTTQACRRPTRYMWDVWDLIMFSIHPIYSDCYHSDKSATFFWCRPMPTGTLQLSQTRNDIAQIEQKFGLCYWIGIVTSI